MLTQPEIQLTPEQQAAKDQRAAQARINGAKSLGPTSAEGKAKSSQNSLKHGFSAKANILIDPDDSAAWTDHLAGYRESYLPTNYAERDIVDELAAISWRKARLVAAETALLDFQLSVQEHKIDEHFPDEVGNMYLHLAFAWQGLARTPLPRQIPLDPNEPIDPTTPPDQLDIQSIELVRRYLTTLDRQFRNGLLNLRQYRKDFAPKALAMAPAAPVPAATEPELINETGCGTSTRPGYCGASFSLRGASAPPVQEALTAPTQNEPTTLTLVVRKPEPPAAEPAPEVAA